MGSQQQWSRATGQTATALVQRAGWQQGRRGEDRPGGDLAGLLLERPRGPLPLGSLFWLSWQSREQGQESCREKRWSHQPQGLLPEFFLISWILGRLPGGQWASPEQGCAHPAAPGSPSGTSAGPTLGWPEPLGVTGLLELGAGDGKAPKPHRAARR